MAGSAQGTVRASSCPDGPAVTLYGTCFEVLPWKVKVHVWTCLMIVPKIWAGLHSLCNEVQSEPCISGGSCCKFSLKMQIIRIPYEHSSFYSQEDKIYAKACASCKLFSQMGLSFMENWCLNTSTKNCNNMLPTMTEQDAADEFCQKFILL